MQCLEKGRMGFGTSTYSTMPVSVMATIGATQNTQEACRTQQRDQRRMMHIPLLPDEEPDNWWNYAIYDV